MLAWADEDAVIDADGNPSALAIEGAKGAIGLLESYDSTTATFNQYRELWLAHSSTLGCVAPRAARYSGLNSYCDVDGDPAGNPAGYSMGMAESVLMFAKVPSTRTEHVARL